MEKQLIIFEKLKNADYLFNFPWLVDYSYNNITIITANVTNS
jgi:hypothetical protein